jgi:hypothetical protein
MGERFSFTVLLVLVLGAVLTSAAPLVAQPDEEEETLGFTKSEFEFEGIIGDAVYERAFKVESGLIQGSVEFTITSRVSLKLIVDVDGDEERRLGFKNLVFEGVGTSPSAAAIAVAADLEGSVADALEGIDTTLADRVTDSILKEWITSFGIGFSPEQSDLALTSVIPRMCNPPPAICEVGGPCGEDCEGQLCDVGEGVGVFDCGEGELICTPIG